jgi:hypothetical protein
MFRESDDLLADEDIESDFLLPLECQQVGLADENAAVTRGISPDCLFRASIGISPGKDSFTLNPYPDQLEYYGSMHNGNGKILFFYDYHSLTVHREQRNTREQIRCGTRNGRFRYSDKGD